ncbi:MAG: hypothetical protein JSU07_06300 [Bacteroidetes bacterium]|nr:hypothetical protein [Bacteroidota bacterium]
MQNNLIVGGGVIITDKVHAAITVTASTLRADSLMLNSTKGIYGTTNINGDVFANNKLTVSGNAVFGGVLTANQGLGLGNNNGLKIITSSNPGIGNILAIGTGVAALPSGGAINDPAPCVVSSIIGSPSSWMYNTSQGYYNKVSSGTNSAYYSQYINPGTGNSYIDVSGSINGSTPAALYINQNCTASTYINQSGGNVYAGDNVYLNSNVTIGTTASYTGSVKVYGQQTFYGANSNQSVCRVLNAASPAFNIIANGNVKIGNIQTPGNSSDAMLSIGQSSKTNLALSLVDNTNPMAPVPFFNVLGDGTTTIYTNYATNSGKSLVAVKNNNITGTQAWSSNVFEVQADGKTFIGGQRQNAGNHTNAMLNIYGKTVSTEVVVTQQNWADYVFANNYPLKSLNDVEQYIKEHKHLPNVPSQEEIQNEGLNLGEINKVQMEKIEELTLYIIALKKELDELKKEVRKK